MKQLILMSALVVASAANSSSAGTYVLVGEKKPVAVPFSQSHSFQFGTVSQANKTVLLKIRTRMDNNIVNGSLHFLRITLNGQTVMPYPRRFVCRLLNKPLKSPVTPNIGDNREWCDQDGVWNVVYAPDFEAARKKKYYADDPYLYVLDVTDLVNPVAENRMEIQNCATPQFVGRKNLFPDGKLDMVIGSLEIEEKDGVSPMMAAVESAISAPTKLNRGEPGAGPSPYRGEVLPGGGFALHIGKNTYHFSSSFSYPDAGFNRLNAGEFVPGQAGWKVDVKDNHVIAEGPNYKIHRTVNFTPRRVEVRDTVTNANPNEPLGLYVRNELELRGVLQNAPIRLAGSPDTVRTEYYSTGNPSVHIVTPDGALGLIAEDNVYIFQSKLYVRAENNGDAKPVAGIRTEMLRLAPGETYTLEWAVYPVAGPDFYDFINLARVDRGANYTALGPWRWGTRQIEKMNMEELRTLFARQKIPFLITNDWVEWGPNARGTQRIGYGTDVLSPYWEYKRQEDAAIVKRIREASPQTKILAYYNTLRETDDDTLTKYADSLVLDKNGRPITTFWTHTGAKNPSYLMIPTLTNSFGKAAYETACRYVDEWGVGIYWDESEGFAYNTVPIMYSNYDGHSCLLDPKTYRIQREIGIEGLSNLPFRVKVIQMVQKSGKAFFSNGPNGAREYAKLKVQQMTEVQHNNYYALEGLLQTPLGYMSWKHSWENFLRVLNMAILPADCLQTDLPHDISPYLFPFTTIEIHPGYMLAEERIVVTHSGNYGWVGQRCLVRVRHFNNCGQLTTTDYPTRLGTEARTAVELKEKEAVVLERLPIRFTPAGNASLEWNATVQKVRYDQDGISLQLNVPQGGELKIDNGEFVLKKDMTVDVKVGEKTDTIRLTDSKLVVTIPAGFSGQISVTRK